MFIETDLIAEDGMINDYEGLENIGLKFGGKKSADPGPFLYAENEKVSAVGSSCQPGLEPWRAHLSNPCSNSQK